MKLTSDVVMDEQAKLLIDNRTGEEISLTFAEAKVLERLLVSQGEILTKEELLAVGWPDRVVAATSLTQCISTLRKKLVGVPEVQLKTVARRGYQLNLNISEEERQAEVQTGKVSAKSETKRGSLWASALLLLILVGSFSWYVSDYHRMLQQHREWHFQPELDLNVGGVDGSAKLYFRGEYTNIQANMWQKHLAPESNYNTLFKRFGAIASTNGKSYSMAVCPDYVDGYCSGRNLINISAVDSKPAGLNFNEFLRTSKVMENRIKYNRLPKLDDTHYFGDVLEHYYHSNIYFPVSDKLLIRADYSMSFVYQNDEQTQGVFFSSTCLTDETCDTTPVKYKVHGVFEQYSEEIDGKHVDVFHVRVTKKQLTEPEKVSPSAAFFYRKLRKHSIFDEQLYFYRVYQDDNTAVWIVPLMGDTAVWTTYSALSM